MKISRLIESCRWALPLVLGVGLVILLIVFQPQPGTDPRAPALPALSAESPEVAALNSPPEQAAALDAFDAWLALGQHSETVAQGVELAQARRVALKELIQTHPQAALARTVPYSVRQRLPEPVVALLETPVSTVADLTVEQACGGPEGRSWRQQWLMLDGQRVQVFTSGERAEVMTKHKLSVHGIAIDEVMAMLDDPLRELSTEEAADRGFTERLAQFGNRLFAVASDAALEAARLQLRATEQTLGPVALPAYRQLAQGQMDGVFPVAMQNGQGGSDDDDLPPIAYSAWTEGAKKMLYIRARFADEAPTYEPVTLATAQARQGEAEAFWVENSYSKSTLTTTYTTVVTLSSNGSAYLNNFGLLLQHARQAALAANANWNHLNFDFYTVITNDATGGFGYIGLAQLNGPGSHLLRNFISVRTASHEYGHNLGLNHSEYWLTDSPSSIGRDSIPGGYVGDSADNERIEYGHKFAVMGSQDASGDFESGRAHYTASDKNRLDWLLPADIVSTTTSSTIRLYRHDVPAAEFASMTTGVARAIKINLNATDPTGFANPYRYWLNYRFLPTDGIAATWLRNGLQVDWRRDSGGFRAVMLDMTPYSRDSGPYGATPSYAADNADKEDGVLLIGQTFSDTGANIHFTPIARGGDSPNEWLDVVVNIGPQGNNAAPVISHFTVSNATPTVGQTVTFAVTATDPNGDTLAYHWDMNDTVVQNAQLNQATRTKSWATAGYYVVRCEVSDMKGGKAAVSQLIRVGTPTHNGMIEGRVTHAGRPVAGALVRGGGVNARTESDGTYVLAGVPVGNATVTAFREGLTFTAQFSNPVQVTDFGAFGIDFAANEPWNGGGGTVAIVRPQRIDVPIGFATRFIAEAFDNSGNPVAFNPTWSVTGGGTINSNGVLTASTVGGPFTVTAQDGALTATATLNVINIGGPLLANGTWTNASGGNWATSSNWASNTIAAGAGNTADFSMLNPTTDATVSLDVPRAIGALVFGDSNTATAATWFLTNGTNGSLMLAGSAPTITVNQLGSGKFANISARLSGFSGFTKIGAGNLILNNATNTLSGPITINAGNIQLNSASLTNATRVTLNTGGALVIATGAANAFGGTLSFGGGTLQFNNLPGSDYSAQFSAADNQPYRISVGSTHEVTFNSNLASSGGTLTKLGTGTLILGVANAYTGGTTLSVGTLRFGHASALGSGQLAITGNATLQAGLAATLSNAVSIATGITGTVDTNGNDTILGGAITGAGTLVKAGTGTLNLSGGGASNTLSGAIHVNVGTLTNDNVNPSPGIQSLANLNGPITVAAGASLNFSQSFTAEPLDNAITLSGSGTGGLGALNLWRNATASGHITLATDATISHNFNTATITGSITGVNRNLTLTTTVAGQAGMTVSGPITLGTGGITVQGVANSGTFSIRLSGTISYTGETHVASGTLMLSGSARIADTATVRIASESVLHLDFTGTDTVGALILEGMLMANGTYGSLTSAAANKSARFAGNGILQVVAPDNFASWAASQAPPVTGGPDGDHDQDGIPNLIEYALANGQERGTLSGSLITFTKRGLPWGQDLSYIIETSTTLMSGSWLPMVTHGPAEAGLPISFDFAPTPPGSPKKFVRLRVTQAP